MVATTTRKSEILAAHCADVGADFGAIVRSANYNVIIGEAEAEAADRLAWFRSHYAPYLPADQVGRNIEILRSGPLVGTPEQTVERLTEANGLGMTYAILYLPEIAYDRAVSGSSPGKSCPGWPVSEVAARPRRPGRARGPAGRG